MDDPGGNHALPAQVRAWIPLAVCTVVRYWIFRTGSGGLFTGDQVQFGNLIFHPEGEIHGIYTDQALMGYLPSICPVTPEETEP
jgi:hypothetical protein